MLVDVLARGGQVLEFVPSVRDHDEKLDHIERVHRLCAPARVRATWTQLAGTPERVDALLAEARRTQRDGAGVWPQYTARPTDVTVNLDRTIAFTFIPAWHKLVQAPRDQKLRMLADSWWREKARAHWDRAKASFFPNRPGSYDRVRFTSVAPGNEAWLGRTLGALIEERPGHPSDVLADCTSPTGSMPG